jgi:tripartite ATP-independent transporter DctM subunit
MVEMSAELAVVVMFGAAVVFILLGHPLVFVLGGIAVLVGVMTMGPGVFTMFRVRIWGMMTNYTLLAVPLFVFMGLMVERSGAAERLYGGLHVAFGGLRGGLAVTTILMGTILAACVGVIAASVIMIGLIAVPSMLRRGYNKELTCGSVCAGGTLGILIPPSLMLVIYGPMANISVGKLFMGAFGPGLLLSGLYVAYIMLRAWRSPGVAPALGPEEQVASWLEKIRLLVAGTIPPLFLMLSVLGVIFFGVASPTEAAAIGALAATFLAICYRRLNWDTLSYGLIQTVRITSMALFIGWGAQMFVGVFLKLGGGDVINDLLLAAPGGKWGSFALIMFMVFVLGMLIDWIGIVFILVPLITPLSTALGFDALWFDMMVVVNLQMSFMTPPMAYAIFYLRGIVDPQWEIDTGHIVRGVIPFVGLIAVGIGLCIAFPDIVTWLPRQMIKF